MVATATALDGKTLADGRALEYGDDAMLAAAGIQLARRTLALDLPLRQDTLSLLDTLDAVVLEHGGRVYLAKDARLAASALPRMYPRLDEWRRIRRELDPDGLFLSALGQRLEMI